MDCKESNKSFHRARVCKSRPKHCQCPKEIDFFFGMAVGELDYVIALLYFHFQIMFCSPLKIIFMQPLIAPLQDCNYSNDRNVPVFRQMQPAFIVEMHLALHLHHTFSASLQCRELPVCWTNLEKQVQEAFDCLGLVPSLLTNVLQNGLQRWFSLGTLGRDYRSRCSQNAGIAWMGGGLTLAWIFVKDLSTCTEGPQRWSFITQKW